MITLHKGWMRVAVKRTTQQSNKKTRGDGEEDSKGEGKREGDGSILRSIYGLDVVRSLYHFCQSTVSMAAAATEAANGGSEGGARDGQRRRRR